MDSESPPRSLELWLHGRVAVALERRLGLRASRVEWERTIVAAVVTEPELERLTTRLRAAGFQVTAVLPALRSQA